MGTSCLRRSIMICRSRDCYEAYLESWASEGQEHQRLNWPFTCTSSWKSLQASVPRMDVAAQSALSGAWSSGFSALRPTDHFGFSKS